MAFRRRSEVKSRVAVAGSVMKMRVVGTGSRATLPSPVGCELLLAIPLEVPRLLTTSANDGVAGAGGGIAVRWMSMSRRWSRGALW